MGVRIALVSPIARIIWGRWESNPHELPRPLLRRLRLPFRHFPAKLRLFRVQQPLCLGRVTGGKNAEPQLHRFARKDEGDEFGTARLA